MNLRVVESMSLSRWITVLTLVLVVLVGGLTACQTSGSATDGNAQLSDSPLVGKFVWHDLISDDVAAAERFYGGVLGWDFEQILHPLGRDYVLISAGGRYIGGIVHLPDGNDADYSRWLPYISVEDVDTATNYVVSAGGKQVVAPVDLGDLARAAAVTDPQGAVIGLVNSRVGDPIDSLEQVTGQVIWNELLASDVAQAATFYHSLAGLQTEEITRRGGQYTLLKSQNHQRGGIMQRPDERVDPIWLTHFAVRDVAAAAGRVTELGGTVLLAPGPELRDGRFALVTDPGGAVLALSEVSP